MEKKITYVKDAHLHIRVDREDLKKWKKLAKIASVNLTTYVTNALNNDYRVKQLQ